MAATQVRWRGRVQDAAGAAWDDTDEGEGEGGRREFAVRASPLTVLLSESSHVRATYHIFVAILLVLLLHTALSDLVEHGRVTVGTTTVARGFGGLARGVQLWLRLVAAACALHPALRVYAAGARLLQVNPVLLRTWRWLGTGALAALQAALLAAPAWELATRPLSLATSVALTLEMLRFAMKVHAAAVALAPRCDAGAPASAPASGDDQPPPLPTFNHYLYYLFAPTLLYRDQYPRSTRTRWDVVARHSLEVVAIVFCNSFLWERFVLPHWSNYGKEPQVEAGTVVRGVFACVVPGVLSFLCGFYCLLHAWLNVAAELLTFGDRLFYEEWWTSSRFSHYFRAWNRVVHAWLRDHVHRPLGGGPAATVAVFLVSALAHEMVLALSFGFWYPVLLAQFGSVGLLMRPLSATLGRRHPHAANLFMWWAFFIGNGLLWSLYPMEYFARQNCPPSEADSFFVPKSWSCPRVVLKPGWNFTSPLAALVS